MEKTPDFQQPTRKVLVLQPAVSANPENLALAETLKHLILTMREHQAQAEP